MSAQPVNGTAIPVLHPPGVRSWEELARDARFQPAVMAARCDISLRQLERVFMANFKKTPKVWTRELRCRLARQLVAQGWKIKAVADELHFVDTAHLCHEFKNLYGLPPRAFGPACLIPQPVVFLQ